MDNISLMNVIKRNNKKEAISFDKIVRRIRALSNNLAVDPIFLSQKVIGQIYDNIKTSEIDELSASIASSLGTEIPDYLTLASRIAVSNLHKNTSSSFSEVVRMLYENTDTQNQPNPLLADSFYTVVMQNKEKLNSIIDYTLDYEFSYFAIKTFEKTYLLKIRGRVVERPQHLFMRVAIGFHGADIERAINTYRLMSNKYFIHATPTLFHAGGRYPQLISCFLLGTHDSVQGLYKTVGKSAEISKFGGGIGICLSNVRSAKSLIRKTNGRSDGIIPYCRVLNDTSRHINQSGKRAGSFACYLSPEHPDILDFLDLKKNSGKEEMRARDLFLALWIPDLFMERVRDDGEWSLFDPDECPGLVDAYGEGYRELYKQYENSGRARKIIRATDLWDKILDSQTESGVPYMLYKDAINMKNNQQNRGTIRNSNLCAEICEYSNDNEYACCVLASIGLPTFVNNGTFDFDKLVAVAGVLVENLNRVIDINYYPVSECEVSNFRMRPLGIGVQGLADTFFKLRIPFDSEAARQLNVQIFESIYYGAVKKSCELAKRDGAYDFFKGSPMSRGLFQFDLWNVQPSPNRYDWDSLRKDVIKYGVRNSLLCSLMPTASTSLIFNFNECIEPITSNIYSRRVLAGDFIVLNQYLVRDLMSIGMWSKQMKDIIIYNNGSIQNIEGIPQELKDLYKTVWEIKQKVIVQMAADRAPFICQTQSMNLFFEEPTHEQLTNAHFTGWKLGLKTGSYYIRTRPKTQAQKFTIDPELMSNYNKRKRNEQDERDANKKAKPTPTDEQIEACSRENPGACDLCSS